MRFLYRVAILFGLSVAVPAMAQRAGSDPATGCTQERHRPPRRRPAQVRQDSLWRHVVETIRQDLVRSAGEAGVAPAGVVMVRHNFLTGTGTMWMPQGLIPAETLRAAYARAQPALGGFPPGRSREDVVFHVRLDPLPRDSVQPGDLVTHCAAQVRNQAKIREIVAEFAGRYSGERSRRVQVDALVARDGSVLFVEFRRSSGDLHVDDFALRMVGRMQFSPATINGVAVDAWVTQPVEVQVP